jgi:hypothetical protein
MLGLQSELLDNKEIQGITSNTPIGLFQLLLLHIQGQVLYLQETFCVIGII